MPKTRNRELVKTLTSFQRHDPGDVQDRVGGEEPRSTVMPTEERRRATGP